MILYPAIDIIDGQCVRLKQGNFNDSSTYGSAVDIARSYENSGCEWLHIVDLDGAKNGKLHNFNVVSEIAKKTNLKIQLGGGIRSLETLHTMFNSGIKRAIISSLIFENVDLIEEACITFPGKIFCGIDVKNSQIATNGWLKTRQANLDDLIEKLETINVAGFIVTDINRDGTMQGINTDFTFEFCKRTKLPVIASGGFSSIKEVAILLNTKMNNLSGFIVGKALLDKTVSVAEIMQKINSQ